MGGTLENRICQEERTRVLYDFNDTSIDYPKDVCLHQLFEMQVKRTPDRIAIVFEGSQLTYSELNQRANKLANFLRAEGIGPESVVGVFMERSLEMVIALYGILKAGGAYISLDPEYPQERLAFMLEDTQVPVLLAQEHLLGKLPECRSQIFCLDTDWDKVEPHSAANPSSGVRAQNLAYVLYTSGSTGKPKGVMNCHSGICNRLLWMQDTYQLTESDRIMQKTPFSFDVSVWEFFWPLLFGARLVVARPGGHKDSGYLVDLIVEQQITTLHFVPSMLQLFLDDKRVDECNSLKRVICSGEALSYELQERFFASLDAELHNLYGPTEAAVDVTYWACEQKSALGFVPIGRPVANTQIYILDNDLNPVPIGDAGELHIGGVQVGRGYLNRPELTKERFIPDPFNKDPEARLYKTGDLACFLEDGAVKYLGRIDHQVKIRGNRIELGEIETVLEGFPEVKQVVVIDQDISGEKRLIAYVVTHPGQSPNTTQLRQYLEDKLPDFMIPSSFIFLSEFPLLPNGKVNRRELPKPDNKRPELGQAYVAPRTQLERYLANIWSEVLQLERVGVHDRFFELGGTSLQAARVINKLQEELAENIYIVSIFESPTIEAYAGFLQRNYRKSLFHKLGFHTTGEAEPLQEDSSANDKKGIDEVTIARMRKCVFALPEASYEEPELQSKNPKAIFILAPPRSGTTLLRVMLAGHPDLFAATELQLLGFNTLMERREAYSGKYSLWLEGTIRAIMEIKGCDAEEAMKMMDDFEKKNYTTKQFYRALQDWLAGRILVDKSPSYVLDPDTLRKAERDFDEALYIHIVRHPYAMVRSFENYHMDQVLFLKEQSFTPRQLGELVWLVSHMNTVEFLRQIPEHRQYQIRFEDLVSEPQKIMEDLCRTFRISFHQELVHPYNRMETKMIDGIHKESKPMGDTRFLEHGKINSTVAEESKGVSNDNFLSDITWDVASDLGYERPDLEVGPSDDSSYAQRVSEQRGRKDLLEERRQRRQKLRKET